MPFQFNFRVLFDLSKPAPQITVTNTSIATADGNGETPDTSGYQYAFKVTTPSGIVCYDSGNPDITGEDWTDGYIIPAQIPLVNGKVEWGEDGYIIEATVTDGGGTQIAQLTRLVPLCHPPGNTSASRNNYGAMQLKTEVRCDLAKIYVEEATNYTYNGLQGATTYKKIRLIYPAANADDAPQSYFNASTFSTLLIPIYYDGKGYQLLAECVKDYTIADGVTVRIKFLYKDTFSVDCFIDLGCLIRGVAAYKSSLQGRSCTMAERINLEYINTDLALINLAKLQPLSGVDIMPLVEEIKALLGSFYTPCPCNNGLYPVIGLSVPGNEVTATGVYKQTVRLADSDIERDENTGIITCDRIAGFDPDNTIILKDNSLLLESEYLFDGTFKLASNNYTPEITFTFFGPKIPQS